MAAKDSDSSDVKKQEELDDITTCCICSEVYNDPKALPCIHTFCMKCLRETGITTNKGPGDEMPCPICRRQFKIPPEGFHGLPKHFFIERLIQVSKVSDSSAETKALCSLCLEESNEQEGKDTPAADAYCVDCKINLCEECCSEHRKCKATKKHTLIPKTEYRSGDQNVMTDLDPSVCEHHRQNILNVYCANCKTVVCAICFIEEHREHEGSHVDKCVDGFRKQIENNIEAMNECISQAQMKNTELLKVKEDMQRRVESLECDVEKRKDEIKQLTDEHASRLLESLCSETQSRLKELQMATDDTDAYLTNLESYNSYCQKILDEGTASDICRAVSDLSLRSMELQQQCQPMIERRIPDFKFHFRQSELEEFLDEDCGNLIGDIEEMDVLKKELEKVEHEKSALEEKVKRLVERNGELGRSLFLAPKDPIEPQETIKTLASQVPKNLGVCGVAVLGKELFVISDLQPEIEVYDMSTFKYSRRIPLHGVIDPGDIVACMKNKWIYFVDWTERTVENKMLRLDTNGKEDKERLSLVDDECRLFVTRDSNVLVTFYRSRKIVEYTPDWGIVFQTKIKGNTYPIHSVKLSNGLLAICHGKKNESTHRVCIVNDDGNLLKSFGGRKGAGVGQVNFPTYLAVDRSDNIMVADRDNGRVLKLNSRLEFTAELLAKKDKLRRPRVLLLDETNSRMVVADCNEQLADGQVLIFNVK